MAPTASDKQLFRRLLLSSADFSECEALCAYATSLVDSGAWDDRPEIREAFCAAIVVAYARPFSRHGDSRIAKGKISLDLENNLRTEEMEMHTRILHLRNKVFAHSDAEVRDIKISLRRVNGATLPIVTSHAPYDAFSAADLNHIRQLARRVNDLTSVQQTAVQERLPEGSY